MSTRISGYPNYRPSPYASGAAGLRGGGPETQVGEKSIIERSASSTGRYLTRVGAGKAGDKLLDFTGLSQAGEQVLPSYTQGVSTLSTIQNQALSYQKFLNLGAKTVTFEELQQAKGFANKVTCWTETVKGNFKDAFKGNEATRNMSTGQYILNHPGEAAKRVVGHRNVSKIAETLKEGKNLGSGLASVAGIGLAAYNVFDKTRNAYRLAAKEEDGTLASQVRTCLKTGGALLKHSGKALACWEIWDIGFAAGTALFCFGTGGLGLIPIIGGAVTGSVASAVAYKGLSTILPDEPEAKNQLA